MASANGSHITSAAGLTLPDEGGHTELEWPAPGLNTAPAFGPVSPVALLMLNTIASLTLGTIASLSLGSIALLSLGSNIKGQGPGLVNVLSQRACVASRPISTHP